MLLNRHRLGHVTKAIGASTLALALGLGAPALAGNTGGNLAEFTLLLELDATTGQFRLDDGDGNPTNDAFQTLYDQKLVRSNLACLLGLSPPDSVSGATPGNAELVSLPGPTAWGIDEGKFALGSRVKKGTGCGQIELGEVARLEASSLLLKDARLQVEAKQGAAARVTLILADGSGAETPVGVRYLLTGAAQTNPPQEVRDACAPDPVSACALVKEILGRTDGGPDSKEGDDGFWEFSAPHHNVEVFEIIPLDDGSSGKLSLKGGGEFLDPSNNRSQWLAVAADGFLDCFGTFQEGDGFSGRRLANSDCAVIPYDAEFDGQLLTFLADSGGQDVKFNLNVCFDPVEADGSDADTLATFRDGLDPATCLDDGSCFPLTLCVGTPVYECFSAVGGTGVACDPVSGAPCGATETCELIDLVPPDLSGSPDPPEGCAYNGGPYPDCDNGPENGTNYACWYRRTDVYVPPDEDTVRVCQDMFINDDYLARGGGTRKTK